MSNNSNLYKAVKFNMFIYDFTNYIRDMFYDFNLINFNFANN